MIFNEDDYIQYDDGYFRKSIEYTINSNGCWICISHNLDKDGYPKIKRYNKSMAMSRYIYEIVYDVKIPPKILVMHSCDTPQCINPKHFLLGTSYDNIHDCLNKNRGYVGELNSQVILSDEDVAGICELLQNTQLSLTEIAKKYRVHKSTISKIKRRKNWKHISENYIWNIKKVKNKKEVKEQKEKIYNLYNLGKSVKEIIKMGFAQTTVRRYLESRK